MNGSGNRGIFDPHNSEMKDRVVLGLEDLRKKVEGVKSLGLKVVLTMGTFDLTHIGHCRYFAQARSKGDFLIVGVDSDEKTRKRKGPNRPIVGEDERLELLCHIREVDMLVLKQESFQKWELIKVIKPDVLIATEKNYTPEEVAKLQAEYCGEVFVLEPQATTSTSAKIRMIMVEGLDKFVKEVQARIPDLLDNAMNIVLKSDDNQKKGG
jgi:rfaE bifunctional protein nucleotidyltransferase chain/domain